MLITAEQPAHAGAIEDLLDLSFGGTRTGKTVYRLREDVPPVEELCFVAVTGDAVDATIRYWPITLGGSTDALLLGPIAVAEHRRSEGLGATLIDFSLSRAASLGHRIVLLVGDEPYYRRFGFCRRPTLDLTLPGPVDLDRFLGLELKPGALDGLSGAVERWRMPEAWCPPRLTTTGKD
ncbi:MAG: N-acetyltransferase [Rhodospirillaceae bacterium]